MSKEPLVKMNLSRAAKKFRDQMPQEPEAPKRANDKKKTPPPPAPEPVVEAVMPVAPVEPTPEPVVEPPAEAAEPAPETAGQPKKGRRVKAKRPRFVREKAEKRERVSLPPLPPPSNKLAAKLLTKNLALPPRDDGPTSPRL